VGQKKTILKFKKRGFLNPGKWAKNNSRFKPILDGWP